MPSAQDSKNRCLLQVADSVTPIFVAEAFDKQIFFVRSPFQAIAGLWQPGLRYGTVHLLFCNQMSFRPGVRGPRSSRSVSI